MKILIILNLLLMTSCASNEKQVLPYRGLDCHVHIHPRGEGLYKGARAKFTLQSSGLSHACVLSQGYQSRHGKDELAKYKSLRDFTVSRNNWTIEQSQKYLGLIPFCSVPLKHSWSEKEVKRCSKLGSAGIKLHLLSEKLSLKDRLVMQNFRNVLNVASDKLVIFIHINHHDRKEVELLFGVAKDFPNTKVIVAHNLGKNFKMLANAPKNIYTETSSLVMWPLGKGIEIVKVWREFGMHKVLLGSDWPVFNPQGHIYLINNYPLSDGERRLIIKENGKTLFENYIK